MTVSKAAAWIGFAALFAVALPATAPRAQDSIERRLAAAHRYAMVADIPNLIDGMARQMAMNFPPGERPSFIAFMVGLDIVRLEVAMVDAMVKIGHWNHWFEVHGDLIVKARSVADIRQAKVDGRTAIVLGFQNTSAFEDRLEFIRIFKDAGVGIAQMTYNTQNLVGSGCYETTDGGLSDFGHNVVGEMNRVGMLCDLSHVGPKKTPATSSPPPPSPWLTAIACPWA